MYPVNIKMDGRACLVIGGGHVAQRKVCTLLGGKGGGDSDRTRSLQWSGGSFPGRAYFMAQGKL